MRSLSIARRELIEALVAESDVGGITAALMAEQADALLPALEAYDEVELRPVPPPTESPQDGAGRPVSTTAA